MEREERENNCTSTDVVRVVDRWTGRRGGGGGGGRSKNNVDYSPDFSPRFDLMEPGIHKIGRAHV